MTGALFVNLLAATLCVLPRPPISTNVREMRAAGAPPAITWKAVGAITVPFEYFRSHIYLTLQLDGKPGYLFLLDSGANRNVINLRTARQLGFQMPHLNQSSKIGFGGGLIYTGPQETVNAEIDAVPVAHTMVVMDLNQFEQHFHHRTDGMLGTPFFRRFVVRVDFQKRLLTLYPPKKYRYRGPGVELRLKASKNFIELPVTIVSSRIFNNDIDVVIDTGSNVTLALYRRFIRRLGLEQSYRHSYSAEAYGLNGYYSVQLGSIYALQIGDLEARNAPVEYLQDIEQIGPEKYLPGAIGNGVLQTFRAVVFDVPHQRLFFEMNPQNSQPSLLPGLDGTETYAP